MLQQAPFLNTVRRFRHTPAADANESRRNMRIADGLALAGLRDHVDEAADTDLPEDAGERTTNLFGPTPNQVPGGVTIDTVRLQAMLRDADPAEGRPRPLLLITINPPPDFTLPNAVWLPSDFASGDLDEASRQRLQDRLEQLTQGDRIRPLVTVAWNAESWSSRNLALRLAALGYTNVYWYRGGLEAWDVAGLPKEPFGSPTPSVPGK